MAALQGPMVTLQLALSTMARIRAQLLVAAQRIIGKKLGLVPMCDVLLCRLLSPSSYLTLPRLSTLQVIPLPYPPERLSARNRSCIDSGRCGMRLTSQSPRTMINRPHRPLLPMRTIPVAFDPRIDRRIPSSGVLEGPSLG